MSGRNKSSRRGGTVVKTDTGAESIAPEGNTVTIDGGAPADGEPGTDGDNADESGAEGDAPDPNAEVAVVAADPFADLPMTTIEDYEFRDLTTATTADPRKYAGVQKTAVELKLPVKKDWKHRTDMVTYGRVSREFRPGSVWGTCDQIVRSYGRAGVPAYVLATKLRTAQIGNKRSHYCNGLPPIGWAEGYIDTYISKGFGAVMAKKAPAIGSPEADAEIVDAVVEDQKVAVAA